eukprot:761649-Hanusia_phi.AAC.5
MQEADEKLERVRQVLLVLALFPALTERAGGGGGAEAASVQSHHQHGERVRHRAAGVCGETGEG